MYTRDKTGSPPETKQKKKTNYKETNKDTIKLNK